MLDVVRKNPALASGLLVACLNAAVEFGVHISARQVSALNTVVVAALAFVVHASSTSTAALDELAAETNTAPPGGK